MSEKKNRLPSLRNKYWTTVKKLELKKTNYEHISQRTASRY